MHANPCDVVEASRKAAGVEYPVYLVVSSTVVVPSRPWSTVCRNKAFPSSRLNLVERRKVWRILVPVVAAILALHTIA